MIGTNVFESCVCRRKPDLGGGGTGHTLFFLPPPKPSHIADDVCFFCVPLHAIVPVTAVRILRKDGVKLNQETFMSLIDLACMSPGLTEVRRHAAVLFLHRKSRYPNGSKCEDNTHPQGV